MIVERLEDMSVHGKLRLLIQRDGDIIVAVCQDDGKSVDVEFCQSGGGSPRTLKALHALVIAMKEDNDDSKCSLRKSIDDERKPKVTVEGAVLPISLWQYEQRALVLLEEEQEKVSPNNALIDFLCNTARLARETKHLLRTGIGHGG